MQEVLGACFTNLGEAAQLSSIAMAANQCRPFSFPRNSITSQDHADARSADAPHFEHPRFRRVIRFELAGEGGRSGWCGEMRNEFRRLVGVVPVKPCGMQARAGL